MDETLVRIMQLGGRGYACSQIMVQLALELRGEENPSLVRAMAGPAYGCGTGAGTCGVLTGGCCLVALYAGKGADAEEASDRFPLMIAELTDWFGETVGARYGGIQCQAVVGEEGPAAARVRCGEILSRTYARALEILAANGVDLG
jgi:hypothetical protein